MLAAAEPCSQDFDAACNTPEHQRVVHNHWQLDVSKMAWTHVVTESTGLTSVATAQGRGQVAALLVGGEARC